MTSRTLRMAALGATALTVFTGCGGRDSGPRVGDIVRLTPEGANYGALATRNGHAVIVATPDTGPASLTLRTRTGPGEWSEPEPIADPGFQVMGISPGVDDAGRPTVAWVARHLSTGASQISTRNADGTWPAPTSIPPISRSGLAPFDLGVAGNGDAVTIWDPDIGRAGADLTATVHRANGTWEPARTIERTTTPRLQTGTLLVAQRDSVTAVWLQTTAAARSLRVVLRTARWDSAAGWQPTRTLPTAGRILTLADAKPLPNGRTLIAWTAVTGRSQALELARVDPDGSLTRLGDTPVGQDQSANTPQLATAPDGSAAALVPRWAGGDAPSELALVRIDADGRPGDPQVLDRQPVPPGVQDANQPRTPRFWGADLALADDGTVTAAWLTTPATADRGGRTTTMTLATIAADGRVRSSETVNDTDGGGIDRARVDQIEPKVAVVSWWRLGRNGRIAGTYGIEVSR
ncbi:MAG: hypothetical protein U0237_02590 [Thermoleophilia bacterium]